MIVFEFTSAEVVQTQALIRDLIRSGRGAEHPELLRDAELLCHEMPRRLRRRLLDFKHQEPVSGALLLKGWPVDERRIGPTPQHWRAIPEPERAAPEAMLLMLVSTLLGDPIAWATQQDAHVVHHVLPIQEHEGEQLGSGSRQLLWWHTEDAFSPFRPDYVTLICMRNVDGVSTTIGSLADVRLADWQLECLLGEHFTIKPDLSHSSVHGKGSGDHALLHAYQNVRKMMQAPRRVSVLFGNPQAPYLRLDPYFMDKVLGNPKAQLAYEELVRQIDATLRPVALCPGDLIVIDNYRAVHGRQPFRAHYNGRDRWLQRMLVARDLRPSRRARNASNDRILFVGQEAIDERLIGQALEDSNWAAAP